MKIAVLGAGNIGATLGGKWARAGHTVIFGARDPHSAKTVDALKNTGLSSADTIANAIAASEAVVLAVPAAAVEALAQEHAAALDGKILIDTTNKVGAADMSAVGVLTAHAPGAKVFRAFSTLGWENFADPLIDGTQADLFYCGPDEQPARGQVEDLIADVGLRPVYVGGLDQVPALDGMTRGWFALAFGQQKGRRLAFKLLAA